MMFRVRPKSAPQKFDDPLRSIIRVDARAAEFQETLAWMAGQQWRDIEFGFAVKALLACRDIPAKKAINPNDFRLLAAEAIELISVDDKKMIAEFIERTDIPTSQRGALARNGLAFAVKHFEPQPLRLADIPARRRQPDFKRAKAPEHRRQAGQIGRGAARSHEGSRVPDGPAESRGRS